MNPTVRLTPLQNNTKKVRKFNFVPKSAIRKNILKAQKCTVHVLKSAIRKNILESSKMYVYRLCTQKCNS